jgi:hypothetical protein
MKQSERLERTVAAGLSKQAAPEYTATAKLYTSAVESWYNHNMSSNFGQQHNTTQHNGIGFISTTSDSFEGEKRGLTKFKSLYSLFDNYFKHKSSVSWLRQKTKAVRERFNTLLQKWLLDGAPPNNGGLSLDAG